MHAADNLLADDQFSKAILEYDELLDNVPANSPLAREIRHKARMAREAQELLESRRVLQDALGDVTPPAQVLNGDLPTPVAQAALQKVPKQHLISQAINGNPAALQKWINEARAAGQPHLVPIFHAKGGKPTYSTPYFIVDGAGNTVGVAKTAMGNWDHPEGILEDFASRLGESLNRNIPRARRNGSWTVMELLPQGKTLSALNPDGARLLSHRKELLDDMIFSMFLGDGDRHFGNLMVRIDGKIVPIDFGLADLLPQHPYRLAEGAEQMAAQYQKRIDDLLASPLPTDPGELAKRAKAINRFRDNIRGAQRGRDVFSIYSPHDIKFQPDPGSPEFEQFVRETMQKQLKHGTRTWDSGDRMLSSAMTPEGLSKRIDDFTEKIEQLRRGGGGDELTKMLDASFGPNHPHRQYAEKLLETRLKVMKEVFIEHFGNVQPISLNDADTTIRPCLSPLRSMLIFAVRPGDLFELLDFGLIDDPAILFDPRGIGIGRHGQARLCTTFQVLATDLAGDLIVSDEPYDGRLFVLRADGSVVVRAVNIAEYYGPTNAPKSPRPIDREDLTVPSAGLGVIIDRRNKQLITRSIIPGYGTIEVRARQVNDVRRGDRLINVEGWRVTTQSDLEDYLRTIGPLETYGPSRPQVYLLRDGKLLRRRALTPLTAISARRTDTPSVVHHKAQVYLHSAGPGAMGVIAEANPSGGVLVKSLASDEARTKLRVGDVITHVEDTTVNDVDKLNEQIRLHLAGMIVKLQVLRNGEPTTIEFNLRPADATAVARGRFAIRRGLLDVDAALADSASQLATRVLTLLEEARRPEAAFQWANRAIARPTADQQLQMPMIIEARAGLAAKLGWTEIALEGYDKAAQAWSIPSGAWRARRRKVELLIEIGRLDQARSIVESWDLGGDVDARRVAMNVAYTYAAYGALSEATGLLTKLQAIADVKERATATLKSLRASPPSRRKRAGTRDNDIDKLISAMVIAASVNDVQRLEELLGRASTGPDVLGREVTSPLMIAAARGHAKVVTMLLNAGADANQRYIDSHSRGNTPLIFATEAGHANIVYLLIKNGADVNCAGGKGQTPLMIAAAQKKTSVVRELIERGANINRTVIDRDGVPYGGYSALMVAAMNGHEDIIQILLDNSANRNLRGTDGMTAHSLAEAAGHAAVANRIASSEQ